MNVKSGEKVRFDIRFDLLRGMLDEAAEDVKHVKSDEVRVLPSVGSIYVGLLVEADSAQQAAECAEKVYKSALNLMGDAAGEVSRRQTSLAYA